MKVFKADSSTKNHSEQKVHLVLLIFVLVFFKEKDEQYFIDN